MAEDIRRTATLKSGLEEALRARGDYRRVAVSIEAQGQFESGNGYLADHPELAVDLVDPSLTDFVVVGTLTKPSFLFYYLQARLVRVRDRAVLADIQVEIKGQQDKVAPRGLAALAEHIDAAIRATGAP